MAEPIRHVSSPRNNRKRLKLAEDLRDELEYIHTRTLRLLDKHRYAMGRMEKLLNRLRSDQGE